MESDDLEPRVAALEDQVRDLNGRVQANQQDAAAARVLAGAADRDVGEIGGELRDFRRAATASFNAMRQDFVDLREDFVDLREHVDRGFQQVDRGFAEMRGRFDGTEAGLQQIADRLQVVINDRGSDN
ncbi:MAG: hypothetical protein ACPGVY_15435 [Mycobacterium sp.]